MRAELLEAIWRGGDFAIRLWAALIWVVLALHPSWGMVVAVALLNGYALAVNRARMTWRWNFSEQGQGERNR